MHKKSRTVVCTQPYGIWTICERAMPVGSPYGIARRSPDRLGWKYRTVLDKGRKGKSIPYGSKRGRDFKLEARTGWHAGSPYGIAKHSWHNVGGGKVGNGETMVARASTGRGRRAWGGGRWLATPSPCRWKWNIVPYGMLYTKWSPYGLNQKYTVRDWEYENKNEQTSKLTTVRYTPYNRTVYVYT